MMASAGVFARLLFICVAGAFFVLVHAFAVNDFTVAYVAALEHAAPVWYQWPPQGRTRLTAAVVLLMSGWTTGGGGVQPAGAGGQ